jgi:ribose 5-phosphate isomerase A
MTIIERALEMVPDDAVIGLGSGRAAQAFIRGLGERVRNSGLRIRGVPTSEETAELARQVGIPLSTLADANAPELTVDGADEVDPNLNLIKGYGRAMVREKIVSSCSRRFLVLVGEEKLVPRLGARGKLPVEVVPFALPSCRQRLQDLGCNPTIWSQNGRPSTTDNGNNILDCAVHEIADPAQLERDLRAIPGVVGTGLFLGMADVVLVGKGADFELSEERKRV